MNLDHVRHWLPQVVIAVAWVAVLIACVVGLRRQRPTWATVLRVIGAVIIAVLLCRDATLIVYVTGEPAVPATGRVVQAMLQWCPATRYAAPVGLVLFAAGELGISFRRRPAEGK